MKNEIDHPFIEGEEIHDIKEHGSQTFHGVIVTWHQRVIHGGQIITYDVIVDARIDLTCAKHGNLFNTVKIKTERRGSALEQNIRLAIEDILMHRYHPDFQFHMPRCNCSPKYLKKVYDFSDIQDKRFRKMFEDLFTDGNWTILKLISDGK